MSPVLEAACEQLHTHTYLVFIIPAVSVKEKFVDICQTTEYQLKIFLKQKTIVESWTEWLKIWFPAIYCWENSHH